MPTRARELGYVPFTAVGSELLFEVFSQRYERGATLVTSKRVGSRSGLVAIILNPAAGVGCATDFCVFSTES